MITKYPKNDKREVAQETLNKEEEGALIQVTFHNAIEEFSNKKKELNISEKVFNKSLDEINIEKDKLEMIIDDFDRMVIFSRTDLYGVITHASEAFCRVSGYSLEELMGQSHNIVRHPDTPYTLFREIWNSLKAGQPLSAELKNLNKNGDTYWVKSHFKCDYDLEGNIVGYSAVREEITDKKQLEALTESLEDRYHILELKAKEANKHREESIQYASLIQGALIPDNNSLRQFFNDFFVIWHPKDVVGGDIYLFEPIQTDNECLLMVIDCTGHGVPGALVTMLAKAVERQIIEQIMRDKDKVISPAEILATFNCNMKQLLKQHSKDSISNVGFDGGILYYNKSEQIIKYAGAETPLFYIENDKVQVIKGSRHSIGYKNSNADFVFSEHTLAVKAGMKFFLTTDGYIDQNGGEKGFCFGKRRFQHLLGSYQQESMADLQELFLYKLVKYQGEYERNDDITLIGLEI